MQGETATYEEVKAELQVRHNMIKEEAAANAENNDDYQQDAAVYRGDGKEVMYVAQPPTAAQIEENSEIEYVVLRLDEFDQAVQRRTQFFSSHAPGVIFSALINQIKENSLSEDARMTAA